MKLGLLSDIHEDVKRLRLAIEQLRAEHVDRFIVLGDVFEMGIDIQETCRLLRSIHAVGVWGNHDFGICVDPEEEIVARYGPEVNQFMTSLRPKLELAGCFFCHIEPWLDAESLSDLWYFEGTPREHQNLDRIFNAVPNRLIFSGHYHTWLAATPKQVLAWNGTEPLVLTEDRHFIVVGALCEGQFGILDTESHILEPRQI